jgi:hypothetical protein
LRSKYLRGESTASSARSRIPILEVDVAGTRDMKFWIMSWGSKAVVLEPESLRNKILAEAEAMAGRYGDSDQLPVIGEQVKGQKSEVRGQRT